MLIAQRKVGSSAKTFFGVSFGSQGPALSNYKSFMHTKRAIGDFNVSFEKLGVEPSIGGSQLIS